MQPLMPLNVAHGTLVPPIGTIPGRVGPIVIITLSQPASGARALAWLSLAKFLVFVEQLYNLKLISLHSRIIL